jgi:hypothetical protein
VEEEEEEEKEKEEEEEEVQNTVIRPILTCRVQSWILMNETERDLMKWERKIMRKSEGKTDQNGYWRISINQYIYKKVHQSPYRPREALRIPGG